MGILQCKSIFYYRYNLFTVEKLFLLKHFVLLCLFTSQTSPASCAITTLSADMFVCWQNALLCHSWNKLPLSVQALPYGPVWNRRFMYFSTGKQKQTASQSSKVQVSTCQTHLDHCGCLTCFKRQTLVQIENNKWFKLSVVLDWQTHSPCSNLALLHRQWRAILTVPLWWHTGASLKCCNCSCPLPWKGG